ncbi:MAG: hypothetical protein RLZZ245_854, partial [Verrucomicrobiota bacterium]
MSSSIQVLHKERIPTTGALVIPGWINLELALHFEKIFSGRKITWLVEELAHHDAALSAHLQKSASGAMFAAADSAPAAAGQQLKTFIAGNGILIFVPGRASTRKATPCHIPSHHLRTLCAFALPFEKIFSGRKITWLVE